MAPLYYCTKGNQTKSFYTENEYHNFNSVGWNVSRFKGLGSMSKDIYKECLVNPILIKVSANEADFDKLEMFFGEDSSVRKDWMMK